MKPQNYAWAVNLAGWLALGFASMQAVIVQIGLLRGHPFDPVVAGEITLMAMVGIVTCVLASCLKRIEARLTKIESERPNSN
jgi:hypothetical protein